MATFSDLQNEVLLQLESYVTDQAVVGYLPENITDTATSIRLPLGGGAGIWEVGEELVNCVSYTGDSTASTVIRGWRGTTKASGTTSTIARWNPRFPTVQVKRSINDTLRALYPKIPAVITKDFTVTNSYARYDLGASVKKVLFCKYVYDDKDWEVQSWKFNPNPYGSLLGPSLEAVAPPGTYLRAVCMGEPTVLANSSDNWSTVSGLPEFCRETVVWGAMWRLYSMSELGTANTPTADQALLSRQTPVGKATDIAKYLLGMYQQSLDQAEQRFNELYPAQKHYVW